MKKSLLLVLILGLAALAGCVHPYDLDNITPAAKTGAPQA